MEAEAMAIAKKHVFVINQLGQSADRRGPFKDAEAAKAWAEKHYHYPAWLVPAEPVGAGLNHRVLDADGNPVQED
jgi:hypothetical protein